MCALQTAELTPKTGTKAAGFDAGLFYVLYRTLESMRPVVNL